MTVSRRIASLRPLATTAMHGRVDALKAAGQDVIDFSIAISHFPAPQEVLDAAHEALGRHTLPYTAVGGAAHVRASLAAKVRRGNGINAGAEHVIVTNGAKQALYQALYVMTDPGDSVIVLTPHWPAYVATAQLLGLTPLLVPQPDEITDAALDALPPAAVLIINNPHNPTGKVLSAIEIARIRAWLERTGTRAIVDESYELLIFDGVHTSLAAWPGWQQTGVVTLYSASQSYAMMGWRAGFAVAPASVVTAMETLQGPITAAVPALIQYALAAAFDSGPPLALLDDYRRRRDLVLAQVAGVAWMTMRCPASGPYLWADVSKLGVDTVALAEQLLTHELVAVMPGDALGAPGFIRLGYIADDVATLTRGVAAIVRHGDALWRGGAQRLAPSENSRRGR